MKTLGFLADDKLNEQVEKYCVKNGISKKEFLKSAINSALNKDIILEKIFTLDFIILRNLKLSEAEYNEYREQALLTLENLRG